MCSSPQDTREQLLRAAEKLFSERGYEAVGTREIAEAAGVNLAAIQYHFGNKGQLFIETVRQIMIRTGSSFHELEQRESPRNKFEAGVRVCEYVRAFLSELHQPDEPPGCRMMTREALSGHSNKDGMVDTLVTTVVEEFWRPFFNSFVEVLRVLAPSLPEFDLKLHADSIIGQCVGYMVHRPFIEKLLKVDLAAPKTTQQLERHIAAFSLRALRCEDVFIDSVLDAALPSKNHSKS